MARLSRNSPRGRFRNETIAQPLPYIKMIIQVTEKNLGKRILAFSLDYLIIWVLTICYMYFFGVINEEGAYQINGMQVFIPFIVWVFFTIGLEQIIGNTLGHYLLDLKLISIDSPDQKISVGQSISKHLFDPLDVFFFIGIILINTTKHNQRLGDIVARTTITNLNEIKHKEGL